MKICERDITDANMKNEHIVYEVTSAPKLVAITPKGIKIRKLSLKHLERSNYDNE